ncbi:unnamed protein product, partial [Scytosiphon promiscuus]
AAGGAPASARSAGARVGRDRDSSGRPSHPGFFSEPSSTDVGGGFEQSSDASSSPFHGGPGRRPRGQSLNDVRPRRPTTRQPPPLPLPSRRGGGKSGRKGEEGAGGAGDGRGDREGGGDAVARDPVFARAMAEAAQAEAEIEAAEAAHVEAERRRTSRVYCEACPGDGVVEFTASRGMHGGGVSWKGLVTAVAAEYVQDLPRGKLISVEAVIVSDLPGSEGQHSAPGDVWATDGPKQQQRQAAGGGG